MCSDGSSYSPYPGDCTAFYQCVNGVPVRQSCSPGLHYSHSKQICDWPDVAKCDTGLVRYKPWKYNRMLKNESLF